MDGWMDGGMEGWRDGGMEGLMYFTWFVCQSFVSFSSFGQLLRYADKPIVTIITVYIDMNNFQVEFYDSFHVYFFAKRRV